MTVEQVCAQLVIGISNGLIISLVALGYTMVYGIVQLINFAHGDLVMLGAFLALTVIGLCGIDSAVAGGAQWPVVILLLLVVPPFCASVNWAVERWVYRPLRDAPKLSVLVSAVGVSFVFMNLGLLWGGLPMEVFGGGGAAAATKNVPELVPAANLLGADAVIAITAKDLLIVATTLPLMAALTWFVRCTRLGTAMRACAHSQIAARLCGIDVDRVISATFVIGGLLAGVAAVVLALVNNSIGFQMGFRIGMDAFAAAVLGGIGSMPGAVLGGLAIGVVRAVMDGLVDGGAQWTNTAVFAVLIVVLVFRPTGLLGAKARVKV